MVGPPVALAVKLLRGFFPKGRSEQAVPPAACQLRPSNDLKGEGQGGRVGSICGRCDRTEGVGRFRWANDIAPRQHGGVHRSIGFVRRKGQGSSNRRDDPFVSRYLRLDVRMRPSACCCLWPVRTVAGCHQWQIYHRRKRICEAAPGSLRRKRRSSKTPTTTYPRNIFKNILGLTTSLFCTNAVKPRVCF